MDEKGHIMKRMRLTSQWRSASLGTGGHIIAMAISIELSFRLFQIGTTGRPQDPKVDFRGQRRQQRPHHHHGSHYILSPLSDRHDGAAARSLRGIAVDNNGHIIVMAISIIVMAISISSRVVQIGTERPLGPYKGMPWTTTAA